jgi:hypothetical protein
MARKCYMCILPLSFFQFYTGFLEDINKERSSPFAVHDCPVEPVDTGDFLEFCAHRVPTVAGALQRTYHAVLWKCFEVRDREGLLVVDESGNADTVGCSVQVWDWTMVAIVPVFRDEAADT